MDLTGTTSVNEHNMLAQMINLVRQMCPRDVMPCNAQRPMDMKTPLLTCGRPPGHPDLHAYFVANVNTGEELLYCWGPTPDHESYETFMILGHNTLNGKQRLVQQVLASGVLWK